MKKRIVSLLSCALILVTCVYPRRAHAVAPALIPALEAAPQVASLLGDLLVSYGVQFTTGETVTQVLNMTYGELTEYQQEALGAAYDLGRWVIDSATGAYKYVVDVDDGLWSDIKTVVDGLFDAGENVITSNESVSYSDDFIDFSFPVVLTRTDRYGNYGSSVGWDITISVLENGSLSAQWYDHSTNTSTTYYHAGADFIRFKFTSDGLFTFGFFNSSDALDGIWQFDHISSGVLGLSSGFSVYGDETAIDVPDYDWNNQNNDKKSFVFTPSVPIYSIPAAGAASLSDYDTVVENLVGLTAADLALQDVAGVDVAVDTVAAAKTEDIGTVIKSALASFFLPDEATLKTFQDTVSEKLPIISDLQNWGNDFLGVLNNPTQFSNEFTLNIDLGAGGGGKYGDAVIPALNTDCYLPYKPLVDDCIVGFAWLVFLWNLYGQIPSIINGGSSALHSTSGIQEMVNKGEDE